MLKKYFLIIAFVSCPSIKASLGDLGNLFIEGVDSYLKKTMSPSIDDYNRFVENHNELAKRHNRLVEEVERNRNIQMKERKERRRTQ